MHPTTNNQHKGQLPQMRKIVVFHYPNTPKTEQHIRLPDTGVLLRKEVIQPHLPVRLPCYDFVPIASPTFDGSPHKG